MRDAGLLQQTETGLYELTENGRALVKGDLSDEEVEAMDPGCLTILAPS